MMRMIDCFLKKREIYENILNQRHLEVYKK